MSWFGGDALKTVDGGSRFQSGSKEFAKEETGGASTNRWHCSSHPIIWF